MNTADYVIIAIVAASLIWAAVVIVRKRKKGKTCCGDCSNCNSGCNMK